MGYLWDNSFDHKHNCIYYQRNTVLNQRVVYPIDFESNPNFWRNRLKLATILLVTLLTTSSLLTACNSTLTKPTEATTPTTAPSIQFVQGSVGIPQTSGEGACGLLIPTTTLPLVDGQTYGWCIQLKTTQPTVSWREELTAPASQVSWGTLAKNQTISADKRTSTREDTSVLDANKTLSKLWTIRADDPPGRYTFRISIDGIAEPIVLAFDLKPVASISPKNTQQRMGTINLHLVDVYTHESIGKEKYHLVFNDDPRIKYTGITDDAGFIRLNAPVGDYTLNFESPTWTFK